MRAQNAGSYYFRREEKERRQRTGNIFPFMKVASLFRGQENKTKLKNPTIVWAAAPVLSKIIYLPALQNICWQEKNKSSVGAGRPLLPPGGSPGTLPEGWESGEGPPSPVWIREEKVWTWRTIRNPPCHGGRPSGHRGTCRQRLEASLPGRARARAASWADRWEGGAAQLSRSRRQGSGAGVEGGWPGEWRPRPQPQGPRPPLWPRPGPPAQARSERQRWGRPVPGRLGNAGSGVGRAEGGWGATGVAPWGPGGCCLPDGGAEPGGSQGCQSQGAGLGLEGRSACWRPGGAAWWAGLALDASLWRKDRGS